MTRGVLLGQAAAFTAAADDIEAGDVSRAVVQLQEIGDYYAAGPHQHVALSGAAWREAEALPGMTIAERAACAAYLREQAADLGGLAQETES